MTPNPKFTIAGAADENISETGRPALAPGELIAELGDLQITARLRPRPTIHKVRARPGQLISRSLDKATSGVAFTAPPEAGRVISRTTDDPTAADAQIAGAFRVATPEGELLAAHYEASTPMLLPGPQPRGMSATRASDPLWPAPTIREGIPCYRFADVATYRATTSGDIARTVHDLRVRKRPAEILATGVRQELATHLAILTFDDGTPDQFVVLIRDGITRWTACMMLGLGIADGERLTAKQVSERIIDRLLPTVRVSPTTHADAFQTAQHAVRTAWLREYEADELPARGQEPPSLGQRAIHLNQILVVPTRLYLPTDVNGEMIGAIDRMVADIHTGQEKWDDDDQFFKQTLDILHAMHRQGVLSDDELTLVLDVDEDQDPLDRAARICKLLLHDKYTELKAQIRRQGTYGAVQLHHAVEILAAALSRPWAGIKPLGSAWTYKGVLDPGLPHTRLVLRSPDSYMDLVPLALKGDASAKAELRLVGAIALVANGRVSTTLLGGSGGSKRRVRRITFIELFKGLLATRKGLTQLALAADWFHAGYEPSSDPLPAVDMDAKGFASLDANGHVRNAAVGGVQAADLVDLALEGLKTSPDDEPDDDIDPVTRARDEMEMRLKELADDAEALNTLVTSIGELRSRAQMVGQDITGMGPWQETFDHLVHAQTSMYAFRPTGASA
ncbi:hypothetical protein [Promicromonospora sp. NPDC023987]|uniref:hypothetical protein n=1 Tax=Promicromonospora sp. NPDC023987 TaxID=3155360 RepID=UPI0033CF1743